MPDRLFHAAATLLLMATAVPAQTVLNGNHSVDGNLCVGEACTGGETFGGFDDLKIKDNSVGILLEDTAGSSDNDWRIQINDTNEDSFFITDVTGGTAPFKILGGAPDNSLYVASNGRVGLGTTIPQAPVHLVTTGDNGIRINQTNILPSLGGGTQAWETIVSRLGDYWIQNKENGDVPFLIRDDAPEGSLTLGLKATFNNGIRDIDFEVRSQDIDTPLIYGDAGTERVGLGTLTPSAPLHVSSPGTFTFFRIEATGATPNTAADMTYTQGPTGNGEYRINVVDGDGPEMRVNAEGFVIAEAGFRVGATDLTVPDYVFEQDYALRPLSEVARFIEQNKHLPDVPSAAQVADEGLDMTQMQMALLKKVEELTLYTLDLEAARAAQEANNATLLARLEALERHITAD